MKNEHDCLNEYRRWLALADMKEELSAICGDKNAICERFSSTLAFGTGGMRGLIGAGTARINKYTVRYATAGFASYLIKAFPDAARRGVVIAHDNRHFSREFCMEAAGVLNAYGIKAYVFESLRPTPELSFTVREIGACGGIVITASHNPPAYNGYKLYGADGCQLVPEFTDKVEKAISEIPDMLAVKSLPKEEAGELLIKLPAYIDDIYYRQVMGIRLNPDLDKSRLKIVYSPQHGAGCVPVLAVLRRSGFNVTEVCEQCTPDPDFSATKNPNPESPDAFTLAIEYAKRISADLIITTDPDCDRLGVAVREADGYTLMTGNSSGAVLLEYILSQRKAMGSLPSAAVMINTIVTSVLGEKICDGYGVKTEQTLTGFKFIGEKIRFHEEAHDARFIFGYEESYGCLIGDFVRDKDGVQASLLLCEAAAYYATQEKNLCDVLRELYNKYGFYYDYLSSLTFEGATGVYQIKSLVEKLRNNPPASAGGVKITTIEDYESDKMTEMGFPKSDVLRFIFEDGSFVAVRPSGTEPKCKYYYCLKANDKNDAIRKLTATRAVFEQ